MIGVLWAYEGWQYVTFSAGETRDPQRVFPRAIALATFALVVLYLLANVGYISALGPATAAKSEHVAGDAMGAILGSVSGKLLSALVLVSIFSATNGLMLTAPRLYFAMARDGVFFERLARISPTRGTPAPRSFRSRRGRRCSRSAAPSSSCSPTLSLLGGSSMDSARSRCSRCDGELRTRSGLSGRRATP